MTHSSFCTEQNASPAYAWAFAVFALLLSPLGCSSSSDESESEGATTGSGGGATVDPNARPCNISTGYPGDENCIDAPDPTVGLQLHYGPTNYDDQAEVERYL